MRRFLPILVIAIATIVWLATRNKRSSSDSIGYQGQQVKLSKPYEDYDDYKNDPENLAPGEATRVQQLVQSAPIAKQFADRKQMISAVFKLKFPGYGLSSYGEKPQADGTILVLWGVEIPKSGKTRYLLFRGKGSTYELIDDFIYSDDAAIGAVSCSGDQLMYSTRDGIKVVEHTTSVK